MNKAKKNQKANCMCPKSTELLIYILTLIPKELKGALNKSQKLLEF